MNDLLNISSTIQYLLCLNFICLKQEKSTLLALILKWSRDFLLYTKNEMSRVLFYNKIWLLSHAPGPCC